MEAEEKEKKKKLDEAATALSLELIAKEDQVRHVSGQVLTRSFHFDNSTVHVANPTSDHAV